MFSRNIIAENEDFIIIIHPGTAYHFTAAFRITFDWFNIGTATRSRCKDVAKNTSQKAARKEKGVSAKSAYHGHDCFGLKSTALFVAFFYRRRYYYFQSLRLYQGVRVYTTRDVVRSLSSLIAYRKGATTIGRREGEEKKYVHTLRYISKPLRARLNAKRRMFYVRVHIFLPSPSEPSPETFF